MVRFLLTAIAMLIIAISTYCAIDYLNDWLDYLTQPEQELIIGNKK